MVIDNDLLELVKNSQMKSGNNYGTGMLIVNPTDGKILLGKRTDTHNMCSPGGKVEIGESPLQGVIRETKEESNLDVKSAKFYDYEMHTADNGKNWVSFMFITTDFAGDIKNQESEVEPWDWYTLDEALEMDLFPPTRKSIERAIEAGVLGDNTNTSGLDPADPDGCPVEGKMDYLQPTFIPFVDMPTSPFEDTCNCAYSWQPADDIFGV